MKPSAPPFLSINGGSAPSNPVQPSSPGLFSGFGTAIKNLFSGASPQPSQTNSAQVAPGTVIPQKSGAAPFLSINGNSDSTPAPAPPGPLANAVNTVNDYFTPVAQKYAPSLYQQAGGQNPKPTLGQKIVSDVGDIEHAAPPTKVPVTPQSYLSDIYGAPGTIDQGGIVGDTVAAWEKTTSDIQNLPPDNASEGTKALALTKAGLDALNAFFTPVSTVFSELATVPGPVGSIADLVNKVFEGVGAVGGDSLAALVNANTAGNLTPEEKATLAPLAQQIGALGAQIAIGKVGDDTFSSLKEATGSFLDTIHENANMLELNSNPDVQTAIAKQQSDATEAARQVKVPVKSESPVQAPAIRINTPRSQMLSYFQSQGYEPITPDSELPTIQGGAKPKSDVPSISADTVPNVATTPKDRYDALPPEDKATVLSAARSTFGRGADWNTALEDALNSFEQSKNKTPLTIESETPVSEAEPAVEPTPVAPKTTIQTAPEETPVPMPPARKTGVLAETKGTGDLKERGLAKSTEAAAVSAGLTDDLGQLPQYRQVDFEAQGTAAVKYVSENLDEAKEVAMGSKAPPRGLLAQAVFEAVKQDALLAGDVDTLRDLANSNLNVQATEAGRQIGYLGYAAKGRPIDAVSAIRDVQDAREAALKERGVDTTRDREATVKSAKKAADSAVTKVTRQTWDQFIQSITCAY